MDISRVASFAEVHRRRASWIVAAWLVCGCSAALAAPPEEKAPPLALKAGHIHCVSDGAIVAGVVLIRDGKIVAVGPEVAIPDGAKVLDLGDAHLTPGLIDANCNLAFEIPEVGGRLWARSADPRSTRCTSLRMDTKAALESASPWRRLAAAGAAHRAQHSDEEGEICTCGQPPEFLQPQFTGAPSAFASATSLAQTWADQTAEVNPHLAVADSLNLLSRDFARLARGGVTTVYVAPDTASVIGARGTVVKTGRGMDGRFVVRESAVQAALGADPSRRGVANQLPPGRGPRSGPSPLTRRPTTRMGVDLVFRKAFYDARSAAAGQKLRGADTPPPEAIPVLNALLAGEIPLRIFARMQHDVYSAMRLAGEFNLRFTLVEATEAYQALPALRAADVPVVFGPIFSEPSGWRARIGESDDPRLTTPTQMAAANVRFALTACELRDEEGLARQVMFAIANGLPPEKALLAATLVPAQLLGIADRCGSISAGMDADLVVWRGEPFASGARIERVIVNGKVVHEP